MESKFKYTPAYCEENIWHLASDSRFRGGDAKVVLVTGPGSHRKLWFQRCSEHAALPVYWDYHVILLVRDEIWQVWDFDTTLAFPESASTYFRKTFRGPDESFDNPNVIFRTIEAKEYIANFSSDRSHMKLPSGDWAAPPPSWPPIVNSVSSNLMAWLDIESDGPGELLTLEQIIEFCSPS
jgi:protein N-terminal glutamine amidohydrolase